MNATPSVGLWHDRYHRYFLNYPDLGAAGPLPGVTGTIGILDKPAVAYWRGTTVASIIADRLDFFAEMVKTGGKDAAVKWAGTLPGYERDKAADTGSLVHVLVEKILRKQEVEVAPEQVPYAIAFRRAVTELGIEAISVEHAVANLTDGWGGTFDIYGRLTKVTGRRKVMVDVKSWRTRPEPGTDKYAEVGIQISAYGHGEFTGIRGDPKRYAPPRPEAGFVLQLRPDLYDRGYALWPVEAGEEEYEVFRSLLPAVRWKNAKAKTVIGESVSITALSEVAA